MLVKDAATRDSTVQDLERYATMRTPTKMIAGKERSSKYVEAELPFATLHNFCGRVNVLESIQAITESEDAREESSVPSDSGLFCKALVELERLRQPLEYIHRNRNIFSPVFWIDISDAKYD
ncbi:hypothetical protein EMPG_15545 [Blastomyces silverae]|uniref:Uncharacterized protein n=1 Tax=Blastomyces silverae TaxID=2060906 RepID=A0A0H1BC42_9EURO|nr:hypothetical protein EMPG_15545 [Blastomyces silverae]